MAGKVLVLPSMFRLNISGPWYDKGGHNSFLKQLIRTCSGLGCSSGDRVIAQRTQRPVFSPQRHIPNMVTYDACNIYDACNSSLRRWKQENQKLGAEMAELGEALAITRQPEFHPRNTRGGR